jgi:tripartite-type tricarboxylate transporter receptor subunit TctC
VIASARPYFHQLFVEAAPIAQKMGWAQGALIRFWCENQPDIPAVGDFVPGYEAEGCSGMGAPRNTPMQIIDTLNKEINAGLADPKMKERLVDLGSTPLAQSPGDFGKLFADEINKWAKVIQFANIKVE